MKTSLDCLACFIRQALNGIRMLTGDEAVHERIVREALQLLGDMDFSQPPPVMGQAVHRLISRAGGCSDPYRDIKSRSNRFALQLYPELQKKVRAAADPFETAVRLAVAGNIIDFGTGADINGALVRTTIAEAFTQPLDLQALNDLREEIGEASRILYLGDNAGEIVFDRLLLEQMPRERITFAVRAGPAINDATREDADEAGLPGLVNVIDTGAALPGVIPDACSPEFLQHFHSADLIIAKGQGNYETLSDARKNIYFLFKVKCLPVSRSCGEAPGSLVIKKR